MSDIRSGDSFRRAGYHGTLRTGAVIIMVSGVVLLALAAFLFSYAGVHEIALAGGVPGRLAGLYPLILDAIVVLAGVAALAFRGAERWLQAYAWLLVVVVFAASGAISATQAAHVRLPQRPTAIAAAILPWILLLLGFGLLLSLLRQRRADRHATPLSDLGKRNAAVTATVGRESTGKTFPAVEHFPSAAGPEPPIPGESASHGPVAAPDDSAAVPDSLDAWPDGPDVRIIPARPEQRERTGSRVPPDNRSQPL